jgi:hypothetical protein
LIAAQAHATQYLKLPSDRSGTEHRCPEEEQLWYDFCSHALSALDGFCVATRIAVLASPHWQWTLSSSLPL